MFIENIKTEIKKEVAESKKFSRYVITCFAFLVTMMFISGQVSTPASKKQISEVSNVSSIASQPVVDTPITEKTKEEQIKIVKDIFNSVDADIILEATK
jgi:hypothetical protein